MIGGHHDDAAQLMADGRYVAHHAQWSGSNSPGHTRSLRRAPLGDSKLPYPAAAFAGAWLHVEAGTPNPEKLLGEMARTVRAEGVIGVHTADAADLHDSMLAEAHRLGLRPQPDGAGQAIVATAPDLLDSAHGDEHCVFCRPLRFRMNSVADLPGAAGVLWGDDNVFVMPDLAPVAPGHLLIVTTEHLTALASADPGLIDVVESAKNRVRELFRAAYDGSDTVFVEHGPAQPSGGGNCVDHAHLHCLPAAGRLHRRRAGRLPGRRPTPGEPDAGHLPARRASAVHLSGGGRNSPGGTPGTGGHEPAAAPDRVADDRRHRTLPVARTLRATRQCATPPRHTRLPTTLPWPVK